MPMGLPCMLNIKFFPSCYHKVQLKQVSEIPSVTKRYFSIIIISLTYSALGFFRYTSVYSIIFSVINTCSLILKHYWGIFKLIQAHSAPFETLAYSQHCYKFSGLAYLEPEAYLKPCEKLSRHIQSPVIGHHSAILRHIQNLA